MEGQDSGGCEEELGSMCGFYLFSATHSSAPLGVALL